jgi:hypothetical protein
MSENIRRQAVELAGSSKILREGERPELELVLRSVGALQQISLLQDRIAGKPAGR